jgi:hypothetical protein
MKYTLYKYIALAAVLTLGMASCDDFLDKPTEDAYNTDNYYQTDDQCIAGVNYLYNSPWYDFQRGYFKVGEVLSGNLYMGSSPYLNFTVNGSDQDLINMSYSLWAVIGHCNTVYNSIKASSGDITESVRNQCLGECLAWKAMAYFYLVRSFGEVPIVHDNTASLNAGDYNTYTKVKKADVYEYILMTLEKAMELLPASSSEGRIDYYCAEALLAKTYLSMAGVSGELNQSYLDQAAKHALDVIENSGRSLMENYSDIFRLANNKNEESLYAWRWTANGNVWTAQNTLQSDLGMTGFDEFGDCWGDWTDPSVDLEEAFGVKLLEQTPDSWINATDTRLKATMMLAGFKYDYFWQDKGGFDYLRFIYDDTFYASCRGELASGTGANVVKHLYGDAYDHQQGAGHSASYMYSSLATHILRLSEVYLIYAEAKLPASAGIDATTTDPTALACYNAVHQRAVPTAAAVTSISWMDIWKERRLEFALEGDRWYDFVRVSYWNPEFTISQLKNQKRNVYWGLDDLYSGYYSNGSWTITTAQGYDENTAEPYVEGLMKKDPDSGKNYFYLPFPTEDVTFNPNLGSNVDGEHVDVRATYSYE